MLCRHGACIWTQLETATLEKNSHPLFFIHIMLLIRSLGIDLGHFTFGHRNWTSWLTLLHGDLPWSFIHCIFLIRYIFLIHFLKFILPSPPLLSPSLLIRKHLVIPQGTCIWSAFESAHVPAYFTTPFPITTKQAQLDGLLLRSNLWVEEGKSPRVQPNIFKSRFEDPNLHHVSIESPHHHSTWFSNYSSLCSIA